MGGLFGLVEEEQAEVELVEFFEAEVLLLEEVVEMVALLEHSDVAERAVPVEMVAYYPAPIDFYSERELFFGSHKALLFFRSFL